MSITILATKLYIPPPRVKIVLRHPLIERLNQGLHHKLTLISAPAGFGKTTLLSEWVAGCGQPVAWLSLDEGDNDLVRFLSWRYRPLRRELAKVCWRYSNLLSRRQLIGNSSTTLLNEITTVHDNFLLVLDDYHVIDSKPVDEALTFLLEHLPPRMHLVIITVRILPLRPGVLMPPGGL